MQMGLCISAIYLMVRAKFFGDVSGKNPRSPELPNPPPPPPTAPSTHTRGKKTQKSVEEEEEQLRRREGSRDLTVTNTAFRNAQDVTLTAWANQSQTVYQDKLRICGFTLVISSAWLYLQRGWQIFGGVSGVFEFLETLSENRSLVPLRANSTPTTICPSIHPSIPTCLHL